MGDDQKKTAVNEAQPGRSTLRLGEALAGAGLPASDLARRDAEEIGENVQHGIETLEEWVKARPLTSVLIGAGVGYVLGRLAR